jgi:hypothetical protein
MTFKIRAMSMRKSDLNKGGLVRAVFVCKSVNAKPTIGVMPPSLDGHALLRGQLFVALVASSLIVFVGCRSRSDRLAVSGEVTLDGTPLDAGSIRLTSTGTGRLFASGALIQNGKFHIPQEKGLPPGTYRVEVSSPDTKAPLVVYKGAPGEPMLPPTATELIPPEYNSNSKHTVEITTNGDNNFKFEIVHRGNR